jgi:cation diffusion facilitator family transporter
VTEGNRRAILAAFLANLGIAVAKFVAFMATGSASMLAESVHSVADTGNQSLLFLGAARSQRPPDAEHPFGYGSERYFWAFVVALVLFSLGSIFSASQGIAKLRDPHQLDSPGWAIGVLLAGIVLEGWSFNLARREANKIRGGRSWWGFMRHSKSPELPVVLAEDLGALLGLMMALVGISLAAATGDSSYDAMASIGIGVLLGVIAVVLAVEMKSLLIGEAASAKHLAEIQSAIETTPRVLRLIHLRTLHLGPDQLLVAGKVEMEASLEFAQVAAVINAIEANVRVRVPTASMIYIEPDVHVTQPPPRDAAPTPST